MATKWAWLGRGCHAVPGYTLLRGPCTRPMYGGQNWYLYKRDSWDPWKKVRKKTWTLVVALIFLNYMKQARSRALVMHTILRSRYGLPEELRERIYRMSNVMPLRNANYFFCTTKLDVMSMCICRPDRIISPLVKLYSERKTRGVFVYIKA